MGRKRQPITHDEVVRRFAARLRQLRLSRGMTQADLADLAQVTATYIGKLENRASAPGIDLVARLGAALGVELPELLPAIDPPDPEEVLRGQARRLFDRLMQSGGRETLQLLVPLLARLIDDG